MANAYPSDDNVAAFISGEQVEIVTAGDDTFIPEYNRELYMVLQQASPARALSLHFPTATTCNALGGHYEWNGEITLFTPAAATALVNNDTNYVWLIAAGTIDSATDAVGWPAADHIKLGTVTLVGGVITDYTDLRQTIHKEGKNTASGITVGDVKCKVIDSATLEPLLDGAVNNAFAVNTGDEVLCIKLFVQTVSGAAVTVVFGPDAVARTAGADVDGILKAADTNATGVYASDDVAETYMGDLQFFGTFITDADGWITADASGNASAGGFVGKAIMYYIPAQA